MESFEYAALPQHKEVSLRLTALRPTKSLEATPRCEAQPRESKEAVNGEPKYHRTVLRHKRNLLLLPK